MTGKVIFTREKNGQWYVTIKSKNGKILFTARGYNSFRNARQGYLALERALDYPDLIVKK